MDIERAKRIWNENRREYITYFLVGVATTLVNWLTAAILKKVLDPDIVWQNAVINILAWCTAVGFAYPTNRKWVFESKSTDIWKEFIGFVGGRIVTGLLLEVGLMALMVNVLHIHFWISKIASSALNFIANYLISKLVVFRKD